MITDIDSRLERITHNLLPATGLQNKFGPPQSLQDRMAFYHTPGVSIAVIDNFQIDWARGFGVRDIRNKKEVTPETLFQAGSISKPIFALGVMRLVQEGKLSLDEDIQSYLTSWQVPANDGWQPKLTLRQILSHTAGLIVHGFPGYQASEPLPTVPQILNGEYPANTAKVEVNILPGIQFRYSGGGTLVAQQALTDLLKKPFPQIMDELVLKPLGLTHSTYKQPLPKRWAKQAATAHPAKGIPLKGKFHIYPEMAAAGLWTTPSDLAKVCVELLRVTNEKQAAGLLTKETIEAMLSPQLASDKRGEGLYISLGFFCDGKDEGFHFGHDGADEGFVARMHIYKNLGKGAIIMLNSNEGYPLLDEIIHAIAAEYEWPNAIRAEKPTIRLENIQDYTGLYTSQEGVQFRISKSDNSLRLHYGEQSPLLIIATTQSEFFAKVINAQVHFEKDDQGKVASLTLRQDGKQVKATKESIS